MTLCQQQQHTSGVIALVLISKDKVSLEYHEQITVSNELYLYYLILQIR